MSSLQCSIPLFFKFFIELFIYGKPYISRSRNLATSQSRNLAVFPVFFLLTSLFYCFIVPLFPGMSDGSGKRHLDFRIGKADVPVKVMFRQKHANPLKRLLPPFRLDPGAVLFDALAAAKARRSDVVLVDTAGRLHNKANLMKELAKLRKIIDRELPGAAKETLLVLDATTGQNGLIQARQFKETAGLTGIVLTKLDGTAKGGIVIAIAQELQVPVKYVGLGEGIKDLAPFDAKEFVGDLF